MEVGLPRTQRHPHRPRISLSRIESVARSYAALDDPLLNQKSKSNLKSKNLASNVQSEVQDHHRTSRTTSVVLSIVSDVRSRGTPRGGVMWTRTAQHCPEFEWEVDWVKVVVARSPPLWHLPICEFRGRVTSRRKRYSAKHWGNAVREDMETTFPQAP